MTTMTTYGPFFVYASGEFELETKTLAGARRCARKLAKLGLTPSAVRCASAGERTWNEPITLTL